MSSPALRKIAQAALDELKRDLRKEKIEALPYNLLGLKKKTVLDELKVIFSEEVSLDPEKANKVLESIWRKFKKRLKQNEVQELAKIPKQKQGVLKRRLKKFISESGSSVGYIIGKYSQGATLKSGSGNSLQTIAEEAFSTAFNRDLSDKAKQIGGASKDTGFQLEHGGGQGYAASTLKVARAKKAAQAKAARLGATRKETQQLFDLFVDYENDMQIELSRVYDIDAKTGKLKVEVTPTLLFGRAIDNQEAAKLESAYYNILRRGTSARGTTGIEGIINSKGSPSVPDAISQTLVSTAVGTKKKKKKVKTENSIRTRVKSSSKGKSQKAKTKKQESIKGIVTPTIFPLNYKRKGKKTETVRKGVAAAPFALIGEINRQLPRTLQKNMRDPRLNYQTGRFADSVRVETVNETTAGYPSYGYTYQRDPYQVFETGIGNSKWASPERDPRKLIDMSIREIAAQYAIGRFYTRRV